MSKNVFLDLGFTEEEAAGLQLRSRLFMALQDVIRKSRKTQKEIAAIIGADQPKVSKIRNGKFSEFSTERITMYLDRLGYDIEIKVVNQSPSPKNKKTKPLRPTVKNKVVAKANGTLEKISSVRIGRAEEAELVSIEFSILYGPGHFGAVNLKPIGTVLRILSSIKVGGRRVSGLLGEDVIQSVIQDSAKEKAG